MSDAHLLTGPNHTLIIMDFVKHYNNFMMVLDECNSDNIDVIYASPGIKDVENMITDKEYSDIIVFHAPKDLIQNLKGQFGSRMDSLKIKHLYPVWQISLNEK